MIDPARHTVQVLAAPELAAILAGDTGDDHGAVPRTERLVSLEQGAVEVLIVL